MKIALAIVGWLVPGGAYLMMRRYVQFAGFALVVCVSLAAGLAMQGGVQWPQPEELQGLDGFTAMVFRAAGLAKMLAGLPFFAAMLLDHSHTFLDGRLHEYGTTLLILAGVFNVIAVSSALDLRKAER